MVPPFTGVAVKVTEVPAQILFVPGDIEILTGSSGFTVMFTVFEVAGLPVAHVAFDVRTQVTASLFEGVYEYVVLFVPTSDPFTFHWYTGVVPPFTGVAVKVTEVPAQILFAPGDIEILTGSSGFTVMFTVFEVAGLPVAHVAFDVRIQVTASLFAGV